MSEFRLLFDEDVPMALILAVVRNNASIDQLRIGAPGAPPFGSADAAILKWCEREARQLVNLDRSTMPETFAEHLVAYYTVSRLQNGMSSPSSSSVSGQSYGVASA